MTASSGILGPCAIQSKSDADCLINVLPQLCSSFCGVLHRLASLHQRVCCVSVPRFRTPLLTDATGTWTSEGFSPMAPKKADYQIITANLLCTTCTLAADLLARSQTPSEWNMTSVPAIVASSPAQLLHDVRPWSRDYEITPSNMTAQSSHSAAAKSCLGIPTG